MSDEPLILSSAHRHGITDADILDAYAFTVGSFVDSRGPRPLVMLIGSSTVGDLLEIGVVEREDYQAVHRARDAGTGRDAAEGGDDAMTERVDLDELNAWAEDVADQFEAGITPTSGEPVPPLIELQRLRLERRRIDEETRRLVAAARDAGASWHRIGLVLGVTAEGARQRFRTAS